MCVWGAVFHVEWLAASWLLLGALGIIPTPVTRAQTVSRSCQKSSAQGWALQDHPQLRTTFCSVVKSCLTLCNPWTVECQAPLSSTISQSFLKFRSTESVMLSNHPFSVALSSCLQSFPASGSLPMSWLFSSSGQSIEASASASVLPMNIQD